MISSSELASLRAALRLVQRDLDDYPRADPRDQPIEDGDEAPEAASPQGAARLQLVGTEQGVFVALPDGRFWPAGAGPLPGGTEGAATVVAVAARAQECLAEILWHSWPRCPDHDAALRAEAGEEDAVWFCDADAGHEVAPIGHLAQAGSRPPAWSSSLVGSGPLGGPGLLVDSGSLAAPGPLAEAGPLGGSGALAEPGSVGAPGPLVDRGDA
jgi:hypothetical protein